MKELLLLLLLLSPSSLHSVLSPDRNLRNAELGREGHASHIGSTNILDHDSSRRQAGTTSRGAQELLRFLGEAACES